MTFWLYSTGYLSFSCLYHYTMHLDFDNSDEEVTDDDNDDNMNSYTWNEIEPESNAEFLEDHGLIEDATSTSEDNTINPIDCYRHFITDEKQYL